MIVIVPMVNEMILMVQLCWSELGPLHTFNMSMRPSSLLTTSFASSKAIPTHTTVVA